MLLEVGLQQKDAIAIAGQSCSRSWGRRQSIRWSQDLVHGNHQVSNISMRSDQSVDLLLYALRLRHPTEQAALLYDVASNYWDRDRNQTQWWVSWLTPVVICVVGSIVGFFLASLFLPLVDLISGLT